MVYSEIERAYLTAARVGRLATRDPLGWLHVVPVCYALVGDRLVSPLDEKPKTVPVGELRRVRNVRTHPRVGFVADHYREGWDDLGWVQVRGTAAVRAPGASGHEPGVAALREKYAQYDAHALEERPLIMVTPETVVSWGRLDPELAA